MNGIVLGGAITNDSRRVIVEREYLGQRYVKGESAAIYTIEEAG